MPITVGDVEGPFPELGYETDVSREARRYWEVPIEDVPNAALAMFLRQGFGSSVCVPEAERRVRFRVVDGTEKHASELAIALRVRLEIERRRADRDASPRSPS